MATGQVELVGSQIGSSGSNGGVGNTIAKVIDGDFSTFYDAANASGDYVGIDTGVGGARVRTVKFAPRRGDSSASSLTQYEDRVVGALIQAADDSGFSSGLSTVDTLPAADSYLSNIWNTRDLSSPPSKRYWRWLGPTGARCNVAELRWIADAGPSSAKPVQPVVSPWGGRFPTGSTTVTISSLTTSALIYYTTDGSTPTTSSTLYTAPFMLAIGALLFLKAIAYDASLGTTTSDVSLAKFRNWGYKPNEDWEDDHGDLTINTVSGGILREAGGRPKFLGGYYWWYGSNVNRYNNISAGNYGGHDGVWCYKSRDFLNWIRVGQVMPQQPENWYHVHVQPLWNEANGNIVMWMWQVYIGGPTGSSQWGVATASSPVGPFTMVHSLVDLTGSGHKAGDTCAYVANSGVGYIVYGDQDAAELRIVQLSSDFLTTTGSSVLVVSARVDAPILIERADGKFLMFWTALNDTNSLNTMGNQLAICSAATPMGTGDTPQVGFYPDPVGTPFNAQFVIAVRFNNDILVGGDFWVYANTTNSRQVWLPYDPTQNSGRGLIVPTSSWDLSLFGWTPPSGSSSGGVSRSRMQLGM